jgi:hypothetical protein
LRSRGKITSSNEKCSNFASKKSSRLISRNSKCRLNK